MPIYHPPIPPVFTGGVTGPQPYGTGKLSPGVPGQSVDNPPRNQDATAILNLIVAQWQPVPPYTQDMLTKRSKFIYGQSVDNPPPNQDTRATLNQIVAQWQPVPPYTQDMLTNRSKFIYGQSVDNPPPNQDSRATLNQIIAAQWQSGPPYTADMLTNRKLPSLGSTTVLTADPGAFVLTGIDATFTTTLVAVNGSYVLTGVDATFNSSMVGAAGGYTLTGKDAGSLDFNIGSVGSSISGGTFSRGRWRKMQEQEAQELAALVRAEKRAKEQADAAAERARVEAKTALDEFRRQKDFEQALRRHVVSTQAAEQAVAGAHRIAEQMRQAIVKDAAARSAKQKLQQDAQDEAEEEAFIERLLMDE